MKRDDLFYCDLCSKEIELRKQGELAPNVKVLMGSFKVTISILNTGIVTELCRKCRIELVSDAILEKDPYAVIATYRGKKYGENGTDGLVRV